MNQHIGAVLDKLLLLGFGLFALFAPARLLLKSGGSEEKTKRLRMIRICGAVMLIGGVLLLLLMI